MSNIHTALPSSTFQTPLSHIVTCNNTETIVVTDSVSCDGRFVLYTIAGAILSKNIKSSLSHPTFAPASTESNQTKPRALWINCTSAANESILNALKKIGLQRDVISSISTQAVAFDRSERLCIHSVANSIAEDNIHDDGINFMKELYVRINDFVSNQDTRSVKDPTIVIFDDISALSVLFGERLTYSLIFSLNSLKWSAMHPFGLILRCSNDYDIDAMGLSAKGHVENNDPNAAKDVPWERSLLELADSTIDVTLLPSGYSRDVHGRLTFSARSAETTSSTGAYNFCLTDNQVLVMRLAT